jgi:hypothetical protein
LILPAWKGIDDEAKQPLLNLKNKATLLLLRIFTGKEIFLPTMMPLEKLQDITSKITKPTRKE